MSCLSLNVVVQCKHNVIHKAFVLLCVVGQNRWITEKKQFVNCVTKILCHLEWLRGVEAKILANSCLSENFKMPGDGALEMPFTCICEPEIDCKTKRLHY